MNIVLVSPSPDITSLQPIKRIIATTIEESTSLKGDANSILL